MRLVLRLTLLALLLAGVSVPAVTTPAPALPAAAESAAPRTMTIAGPSRAVTGERVHLIVADGPAGASYAWDLDGNGSYETATGTEAEIVVTAVPPLMRVGVRAVDGRVSVTATRKVTVVRPTTARVIASPPDPQPGEKVTFRVVSRSDVDPYVAYAWDVEGVPTQRTSTTLDLPGSLADQVALALSSKGTGFQVTSDPTLTVTVPPGQKNRNRILSVHVKPISENGAFADLSRTLRMRPFTPTLQPDDPTKGKTVDCDNPPEQLMILLGTCAAIGVFDSGLQGAKVHVSDATPSVEGCYPTTDEQIEVKQTRITELKNLAYPPPQAIVANLDPVVVPGGAPRPRAAAERKGKEACQPIGARTQSFDFGDGTVFTVPQSGQEAEDGYVFEHAYDDPGVFTITMTTKVPYFGGETKKGSALKVRWFTATKSTKITIGEAACHPLEINGISITPVYDVVGNTGDLLGTPCFIPETSLDGHKVYRPESGYSLRLGSAVAGVTLLGNDVVVDPSQGLITSPTGFVGYYRSGEDPTSAGRAVTPKTTALTLTAPTLDPALGVEVMALPARLTGNAAFEGLTVTSTQAYLRADGADALLALSTSLPAPLAGATPPIVLDRAAPWTPPGARHRRLATRLLGTALPDTDFSVDLSGLELGGFDIREGLLAHRTTGGWIAGLTLEVADLGTINAPYAPPPAGAPSSDCRTIDGPSGIQLGSGGGFEFGGVQLDLDQEIPLGPAGAPLAGLGCLAASATGNPFVVVGKVGASVPKDGFVKVNGCVALGVLDAGQTGAGCDESFVAPSDLVWLRTTGTVSLGHYLDLASAYADLRVGSDYAAARLGGDADFAFANFTVEVGVDGTVVFAPSFAFDLIGSARICASFLIEDICGRVQGGVSSKGFGACFDLGGIVYRYGSGWDVFVASCDLKSYIGVQRGIHERRSGSVTATMPPSTAKAAFVVHSNRGVPPRLELVAPSGRTISDDGSDLQRDGDVTIAKYAAEGVTTVSIDAPEPGAWQVRALPETTCSPVGCSTTTPDITVDLRTPIPEPVVTGDVTGSGATRVLSYDVDADADDQVVLVEEGAFGSRQLGVLDRGASTFTLPRSGVAERRTVTAVVERNGVPYRTIELDAYDAPAAARLQAPRDLTIRTKGSSTTAGWAAVAGARAYEVRATLGDGRSLRIVVPGTSAVLPGVTAFTSGTVRVVALGSVGRDSSSVTAALRPQRTVVRSL